MLGSVSVKISLSQIGWNNRMVHIQFRSFRSTTKSLNKSRTLQNISDYYFEPSLNSTFQFFVEDFCLDNGIKKHIFAEKRITFKTFESNGPTEKWFNAWDFDKLQLLMSAPQAIYSSTKKTRYLFETSVFGDKRYKGAITRFWENILKILRFENLKLHLLRVDNEIQILKTPKNRLACKMGQI